MIGGREPLSRSTILLHWLVGLSVLGMLGYGFWLQTLPSGPEKTGWVQIHKSLGMIVFVFVLIRVAWRLREGFPADDAAHQRWERRGARGLHVILIAATVLMPISGILRSLAYARPVAVFGYPVIPKLFEQKQETLYAIAANTHDALALIVSVAIFIHLLAALKHHLVDRDQTLARMLPRLSRRT